MEKPAANLSAVDITAARPLGLSTEEEMFCARSCRLLFTEIGLGSALTYLFSLLREHIPLTRIFCGFRQYKLAMFTPMADTLPNAHNRVRTLATSSLTQEQIERLVGSDEPTPYAINNAFDLTSPVTSIRIEDLASYLRIPLFTTGEATFQMIFCSHIAGTFSEALMRSLITVTRPLGEALQQRFLQTGDVQLAERANAENSAADRLGLCPGLHDLLQQVRQAASTDCTVLILGETGTGKEMVADAVYEMSDRHGRPFVKVNCGAIHDQLIDSELFGHEKGAFTGAYGAHTGYFEAANGGTIFLDEIGDLPLPLQARLLRVLDRREIRRMGGSRAIPLDIRIIAATHRDLPALVRQGRFREDLWYRLNVFVIQVPPLRSHRMDIPVLAQFFLNTKARQFNIAPPPLLSPEQATRLYEHNWPGNIRELEHMAERVLVRSRIGTTAMALAFDKELEQSRAMFQAPPADSPAAPFVLAAGTASAASPVPPEASPALAAFVRSAAWPTLRELSDHYIRDVLRRSGGKIGGPDGAAALLGVHPNTLRVRQQKKRPAPNVPV